MSRPGLVIIGASTGGPGVVGGILGLLPPLPASVIVVQHMPRFINESFVRTLGKQASMPVRLIRDGDLLEAGTVYVAPSDVHCTLVLDRTFHLAAGPRVNYVCPSIDVTMESVRTPASERALVGVLLTGMGRDGAAGMGHLKRLGALTLAQNERTSAVYGMPAEAVKLGCVDRSLSPEGIAREVASWWMG
jgi:two-component system, chemotaxis family, protein-glutamate methylesterase/glutaminase